MAFQTWATAFTLARPIPNESLGQADSKNMIAFRIPVHSDPEIRKKFDGEYLKNPLRLQKLNF